MCVIFFCWFERSSSTKSSMNCSIRPTFPHLSRINIINFLPCLDMALANLAPSQPASPRFSLNQWLKLCVLSLSLSLFNFLSGGLVGTGFGVPRFPDHFLHTPPKRHTHTLHTSIVSYSLRCWMDPLWRPQSIPALLKRKWASLDFAFALHAAPPPPLCCKKMTCACDMGF